MVSKRASGTAVVDSGSHKRRRNGTSAEQRERYRDAAPPPMMKGPSIADSASVRYTKPVPKRGSAEGLSVAAVGTGPTRSSNLRYTGSLPTPAARREAETAPLATRRRAGIPTSARQLADLKTRRHNLDDQIDLHNERLTQNRGQRTSRKAMIRRKEEGIRRYQAGLRVDRKELKKLQEEGELLHTRSKSLEDMSTVIDLGLDLTPSTLR